MHYRDAKNAHRAERFAFEPIVPFAIAVAKGLLCDDVLGCRSKLRPQAEHPYPALEIFVTPKLSIACCLRRCGSRWPV